MFIMESGQKYYGLNMVLLGVAVWTNNKMEMGVLKRLSITTNPTSLPSTILEFLFLIFPLKAFQLIGQEIDILFTKVKQRFYFWLNVIFH